MWYEVVSAKTKEEYKDILDKFKKEFNWNNRNVNQPSLNMTLAQVQDTVENELKRSALVYVIS
jgi:predicted GTPase